MSYICQSSFSEEHRLKWPRLHEHSPTGCHSTSFSSQIPSLPMPLPPRAPKHFSQARQHLRKQSWPWQQWGSPRPDVSPLFAWWYSPRAGAERRSSSVAKSVLVFSMDVGQCPWGALWACSPHGMALLLGPRVAPSSVIPQQGPRAGTMVEMS